MKDDLFDFGLAYEDFNNFIKNIEEFSDNKGGFEYIINPSINLRLYILQSSMRSMGLYIPQSSIRSMGYTHPYNLSVLSVSCYNREKFYAEFPLKRHTSLEEIKRDTKLLQTVYKRVIKELNDNARFNIDLKELKYIHTEKLELEELLGTTNNGESNARRI